MSENLTTDGQKLEKAEKEIVNLKKEIVIVKAKNQDLQGRLKITLSELEVKQASINKMNTGSKTLTNILCSQKSPFDKSGLSYDHGSSTSNVKGKTIFASGVAHATPHTALSNNVSSSFQKKNVSRAARTSTCHHCGKKGHIRPHCKKLNSLPKTKQWRKNFSPPKTTPIWVRKFDLTKEFAHTMLKAQTTELWVAAYKKP